MPHLAQLCISLHNVDMTIQDTTELRIPTWTFADRVRKARIEAAMDQRSFADAVGITSSTLAAYETGRSHPRFKDAGSLATRLEQISNIPRRWFLESWPSD